MRHIIPGISEKKALKKLGISDWGHMTKDKVGKFASMALYMDPETAKAAMEKFPEYKDMACQLVETYKEMYLSISESNDKSVSYAMNGCKTILDSMSEQLNDPDLSPDHKLETQNNMIKVIEFMREIDNDNKTFLRQNANALGIVALSALGLGASILGAKIRSKMK